MKQARIVASTPNNALERTVKLTRFRGHVILREGGVHHVEVQTAVSGGVSP